VQRWVREQKRLRFQPPPGAQALRASSLIQKPNFFVHNWGRYSELPGARCNKSVDTNTALKQHWHRPVDEASTAHPNMIVTMRTAACVAIALACAASASAFSAPSAGVLSRRSHATSGRGSLGLRAQQTSALPDISRLGKVAQELGRSLQYAVQEPLRAQYSTAMITRFSYFLAQGVGVALAGINQGTVDQGRTTNTPASQVSSRTLDPGAVIGALADAILADSDAQADAAAAKLDNLSMKEKPFLANDEQRALFNKNFQSIVQLIKTDMKNIENGKYKLPYDMEFGYAPQWSPLPVLNKLNIYVEERTKVIDRMLMGGEAAFEVRKNFKPSDGKYPDYYLQNFHYQSDGWLSARSAEIYDYQVMRREAGKQQFFWGRELAGNSHGCVRKSATVESVCVRPL
jgi:hypothetical protein